MIDKGPRGVVVVPVPDWIYSQGAISLMNVSHNLPSATRFMWKPSNSIPIAAKRQRAVEECLHAGAGWVCFLDADHVFPAKVVHRLLDIDADIACGLYVKSSHAGDYTAVAGHVHNLPDDAPDKRPVDHEDFRWRNLDLRKVGEEMGVTEVDAAGTGCMMIHRHVFEGMESPWFVANRNVQPGTGEDLNFCIRAKRAGMTIKVDTTIQARHIGADGVGVPEARGHWREKVGKS